MRSGNPALNENTFSDLAVGRYDASLANTHMTIQGTAFKTCILLGLCVGMASMTFSMVTRGQASMGLPLTIGGGIVGFLIALALTFKPTWAPFGAPLYALAQGLFLGGISAIYELKFGNGIVLQAVSLTFGTLFALLMAYQFRLIRATENFKLGVFAATGGIALVYMAGFVLSFFGIGIPYIHQSGWIGIGFSAFVVVIAALNLVLDFDFIEEASNRGAPKYLEWYGAFGLMVTLVWLYLEILRLLAKLQSRND